MPENEPIEKEELKVTEPEVTEPEVTEPEVVEPQVVEPQVTEPQVTEPQVTEPQVMEPEVVEPKVVEPEPEIKPVQNLSDFLRGMNTRSSRHTALKIAMALWNNKSAINPYLENMDDEDAFFRLAAKQNGFLIHRIKGDLNLIKILNLPAILEFYLPGGLSPRYLTISKIQDREIMLRGGDEEALMVDQDEMESYWSGPAYIPWKNYLNYTGLIPLNAPRDSIITLKMLLQDIGFDDIEVSPLYDQPTKAAVKEIQKKHGLSADGIVGPLTKIVLYNEKDSLKIPNIIPKTSFHADKDLIP